MPWKVFLKGTRRSHERMVFEGEQGAAWQRFRSTICKTRLGIVRIVDSEGVERECFVPPTPRKRK